MIEAGGERPPGAGVQGELRVTGISRRYGATVALDGVNLTVRAGEVHALIGENGAGKSTLMGVLAGAVRPDSGEMSFGGVPYAPATPLDARRRGIALIHQELSLCPHLTVGENVLLGGEAARFGCIDRAHSRKRAFRLLNEFPHPELHPDRRVRDLSLPARQIVEICRALAADARVVLMDEPTSSLQGDDVARLFDLIRRLTARGVTIIYISHFLEEVRQIADRYTVLRDGRNVASGVIAESSNESIITAMVGRVASGLFPARQRAVRVEVAMSVRGVTAPPRLREASFDLRRGEILGIGGLLGSGRTELVRALFGLDLLASGTLDIDGRRQSVRATTAQRLGAGVGFVSEDRAEEGLALAMSVSDNVCATSPRLRWPRFGVIDLPAQDERARHWIGQLHIRGATPTRRVRALSGGNQQKVAIARLLQQEADILLLDEPTRGIDIGSKAEVYELIVAQAAAGCAVLIVSSYLPELFGLCDRLAVMCRGRLSEARHIDTWTPEAVLAAATDAR